MTKILIQPKAREDIKNIWLYTLDAWGEKQADNYTAELGLKIESLVDNIEIGFTNTQGKLIIVNECYPYLK